MTLKFMFFKKATKIDKIFTVDLMFTTLITLLRVPIYRPNWQYKARTAKMA